MVMDVLPSQNRDPRWATERIGDRLVGESDSLISQSCEAWNLIEKIPIEVIDKDEDHVLDIG